MQGEFHLGEWLVRPLFNQIEGRGETRTVEPKIMDVLVYLAQHPGEVLPKERIIQAVWPDTFATDDLLKNAIFRLRKAFEDNPKEPAYIQTIPRRGYRLVAEVVEKESPEESPYRILKKIGEGGMGEVLLAEDQRLGRRVALKFLSEDLQEDRTALRRFEREARAGAAVDHPYLCKIYESGRLDDRTFLALEYVEGRRSRTSWHEVQFPSGEPSGWPGRSPMACPKHTKRASSTVISNRPIQVRRDDLAEAG